MKFVVEATMHLMQVVKPLLKLFLCDEASGQLLTRERISEQFNETFCQVS